MDKIRQRVFNEFGGIEVIDEETLHLKKKNDNYMVCLLTFYEYKDSLRQARNKALGCY